MNGVTHRLTVALLNAFALAAYWSCVGVRRLWSAVRR